MRAEQMLRLFPRGWRERYGDEFLATAGDAPLRARVVVDIAVSAVDAWTSIEVRRATRSARTPLTSEGALVTKKCLTICGGDVPVTSRRDAVLGALAMIGCALVLTTLAYVARRAGYDRTGQALAGFSFPASILCGMPFLYLRGRSWRTHVLLIGVPLLILAAIAVASVTVA